MNQRKLSYATTPKTPKHTPTHKMVKLNTGLTIEEIRQKNRARQQKYMEANRVSHNEKRRARYRAKKGIPPVETPIPAQPVAEPVPAIPEHPEPIFVEDDSPPAKPSAKPADIQNTEPTTCNTEHAYVDDDEMEIYNPTITEFTVPVCIFNKWIDAEHISADIGIARINDDDISVARLVSLINETNVEYYLSYRQTERQLLKNIYNTSDDTYRGYIDPDKCKDAINNFVRSWGLNRFSSEWKAFPIIRLHTIPPYLKGMYIFLNLANNTLNNMIDDATDIIYVGVHPDCILMRQIQHHLHYSPLRWMRDVDERYECKSYPCNCCILVPLNWCTPLPLGVVEHFYIDTMIPALNRTGQSKRLLNLFNAIPECDDDVVAYDAIKTSVDLTIGKNKQCIETLINKLIDDGDNKSEVTCILPLGRELRTLNTHSSRRVYLKRVVINLLNDPMTAMQTTAKRNA